MLKSASISALIAMVAAGGAFVAPVSVAQDAPSVGVSTQEAARRHAATKDALALVSQAREAYQAKRYTDAVEHYRNALSVLPKAPATEKLHQFINESLSDALIARAIDYRSVGRTEEAVNFLREAVQLAPNNERAKPELIYTQDPVRTNPALTPAHVGDVEEVNRLLSLGYGYLELGKYDAAISAFESVSQYDPYNVAARRGIEKAQNLRQRYYNSAHDKTRSEMLAEVGKTWEDALGHTVDVSGIAGAEGNTSAADTVPLTGEDETAHADALSRMQVDGFSLDDNTIDEAIEVLRNYIKRFETSGTRSARHIDVRANFGAQDTPERREMMQRRASIRLDGVSMKAVLDEVARLYGADYYYVPFGVEFSYEGKDYGRLVERVFNVPPHFFDKAPEQEEDSEDDAFGSSGRMAVKRENPVKVLTELGVSFPEGANALYRASTRKLIVRNTVQNLTKIEELLNAPPPNQWVVVLNVIAVETSDTNLEELGFDWLLNMRLAPDLYSGGGTSQAVSGVTGMPSFSSSLARRGGPQGNAVTSGLRSLNEVTGAQGLTRLIQDGSVTNYASSRNAGSPEIFSLRGVWTAADVTMVMRGLSQKTGVDMLQNPRLVFTPGNEEQVSIVNVREMFYPESYDAPQIPTNRGGGRNWNNNWDDDDDDDDDYYGGGSSTVVAGSHPTDFVRYGYSEEGAGGIGGIIQIHKAEPAADGQSIHLSLTTTINEFEGFVDWGSPMYAAMSAEGNDLGEKGQIRQMLLAENHIYQPIFRRRMINTSVTIANGAVLVMGGMQEARMVRFEDKVPILGDLPLIGRLFRSKGEQKERRALLIFAKVDIVDPTGRSVNGGEADVAAQSPM